MANENFRNFKSIANITGEPREDDDFDYKRAYLLMCSEMSDMIDRLTRALTIAESICIREAITREDIMREDIIA